MPCTVDLLRHIQGADLELKEACKKNYWHKALKSVTCVCYPGLFAEHSAADHVFSSLSPAVGLLEKIKIGNRFDLFPGRTSKELKENINKGGSA